MSSGSPKLRSDLILSCQEMGQEPIFILKDPLCGRLFRLREPEYFIACQLDGVTSAVLIRQRAHFKAFDPNRLLTQLLRRAHFFFTPHFLALSIIAILAGLVIALFN